MTSVQSLPSVLEQLLRDQDFDVPPYPAAALKLRQIIDSGNFGLSNVADAAGTDPVLAAQLLRIANSAIYAGHGPPITSLNRAVNRLGARAISSLAMAASMSSAATSGGALMSVKYRAWRRTLCCALVSQKIAQLLSMDPEQAFLSALLFGFGRSVALGCLEQALSRAKNVQPQSMLEWLASVEPYRPELARRVAEQWKLPAEIVSAVSLGQGDTPLQPMAELVALADQLGGFLDQGQSAEQVTRHFSFSRAESTQLTDFIVTMPETLEQLLQLPQNPARQKVAAPVLTRPSSNLTGEQRPLTVKLEDLRSRKAPCKLEPINISQDGLSFHSVKPMAEGTVARLGLTTQAKTYEGWFNVLDCTNEQSCFRIEAQSFAASRELRELLNDLWIGRIQ